MTEIKVTITHELKEYRGEIMTIESTSLGFEGNGFFNAAIKAEGSGLGITIGGYSLDEYVSGEPTLDRRGTAFGMDHIMRLLETVGASSWEDLPNKDLIVLFETGNKWRGNLSGIAGLTNGKVLIFKDHAALFNEQGAE